jgi:hypothetical protein
MRQLYKAARQRDAWHIVRSVRATLVLAAAVVLAPITTAAAAPSAHSPSACALAWNHGAGATLRALVVRSHARAAFIDPRASIGTDTWTKAGGQSSTTTSGCSIQFILRTGKTLSVWGAWKAGSVATWHGPVASGRAVPVPDNARVHTDGTVGFHG